MNDLRIVLLVFGVCVIAGIYIWGTLQSRKLHRHQTIRDRAAVNDSVDVKIASIPDNDVDYSSALAVLNQSIATSREEPVETDVLKAGNGQHDLLPDELQMENETGGSSEERDTPQDSAASIDPGHTERGTGDVNRQIITLHIIPRANSVIDGEAILDAVEQLDMAMGEMQIFHHFGVGEMKMEKELFSLANMMEPGSFNFETMENFTTPGLVMFMCLPAVIDGQVVFELMLSTARRMADMFNADVCDENRALINEQKVESIRSIITA